MSDTADVLAGARPPRSPATHVVGRWADVARARGTRRRATVAVMFDHVTIRASDRAASERFYSTLLEPLGIANTYSGADFFEWNDFSIKDAEDDTRVTRNLHIGFIASSRAQVDEAWQATVSA